MSEDLDFDHGVDDLMSLDFSETADAGSVMEVRHPTARTPLISPSKVPVTITVVGVDSDVYIKNANQGRDKNVEELRRKAKFSSAADEFKTAKLLAKCTLGWTGIPQGWVDGTKEVTPAEFSYENAVKLYTQRGVKWIKEQVDDFIADRGNFIKN